MPNSVASFSDIPSSKAMRYPFVNNVVNCGIVIRINITSRPEGAFSVHSLSDLSISSPLYAPCPPAFLLLLRFCQSLFRFNTIVILLFLISYYYRSFFVKIFLLSNRLIVSRLTCCRLSSPLVSRLSPLASRPPPPVEKRNCLIVYSPPVYQSKNRRLHYRRHPRSQSSNFIPYLDSIYPFTYPLRYSSIKHLA